MMTKVTIENQHSILLDLVQGRLPDDRGRFGGFGGRYVPESLMVAVSKLEVQARRALSDPTFIRQLETELQEWVGRPTALTQANSLSRSWGATIIFKREDLAHTGAHKINNALGQALLAIRCGAKEVIAETGAGQHGVAAAAACARVGLPCIIYMGAVDADRQRTNVDRMQRLGARVVEVSTGDATLRAAVNEALRHWVHDPVQTYYMIGSAIGPHPYPWLVREFQKVIGQEARQQIFSSMGRLPHAIVACVGGGSNAIGLFHEFLLDREVRLVGVEAGGDGSDGQHAASLTHGRLGVLHGNYTYVLQDEYGQISETTSISAGLDYPAVGPEHALLKSIGRVQYETATDIEVMEVFDECCALEGIIPALETCHALVSTKRLAESHPDSIILVGLSGRGDKDLQTVNQSSISMETSHG